MKLTLTLLFCASVCCFGCANQTETTTSETEDGNTQLPDSATSGETILTAVNAHCPIMGGEVTDDGGRTDWNGKTIGFCCPGCIDEWKELTEEEKESKLTKTNSDEGHDHGDAHGDEEAGA